MLFAELAPFDWQSVLTCVAVVYGVALFLAFFLGDDEPGQWASFFLIVTLLLPAWGLLEVARWVGRAWKRARHYEHDPRPSSDPAVRAMAQAMVTQYQNSPAGRREAQPDAILWTDVSHVPVPANPGARLPPVRVDTHRIAREGYMLRIGDRVIDTDEIRAWRDSVGVVLRVVRDLTPAITLVEANRLLELVRPLVQDVDFEGLRAGLRDLVNRPAPVPVPPLAAPPLPGPRPRPSAAPVEGERNLEL